MTSKLDKTNHSVYALHYHFVQCIKDRRKVLDGEKLIDCLKTQIYNISQNFQVEVLGIEPNKNHFHLFFKGKPTLDLVQYIKTIKTITSREIQRNFPEVKKKLWKGVFWSPSYFLATSGQVTIDILKKYINGQ